MRKLELYKKGDIIVRTRINDVWSTVKKGRMYKVPYTQSTNGSITISGGWHINHDCYRRATDREIEFFNTGIRNINKIPKSQDNYSIF